MRTRFLSSIAFALLSAAAPLVAQERTYETTQPTAAELVQVAATLVQQSAAIAEIWPGFWTPQEAFLLLSPMGGMLLVAPWMPPPEWQAVGSSTLPDAIRGRIYEAPGHLPGFGPASFPGEYQLAGHRVYALPPMGRTLATRVRFFLHEVFHFFQRRTWVGTPEDSIEGAMSPARALRNPAIVKDSSYRTLLLAEAELLRQALAAPGPDSLLTLLRHYTVARTERVRDQGDVLAVERRFERREGTAHYLGCRASTPTPAEFTSCAAARLHVEGESDTVLAIMRWRLYSTGAILSYALDELAVEDWRGAVARGTHLDQLIARAVGLPGGADGNGL